MERPAIPPSARLIGVFRRPQGLFARISCRHAPFEAPAAKESESLPDGTSLDRRRDRPYVEVVVPLEDLPERLFPAKKDLFESWRGLARVTELDSTTSARIRYVLIASLPEPCLDPGDCPPLALDPPPAPFRPTAARPRAYRGTKDRPPKARRPRAIDLRPHLCRAVSQGRLLRALGHDEDPYTATWHVGEGERLRDLPILFRRHLLWGLRCAPLEVVHRFLEVYWGLGLDRDEMLRRGVGRLLASWPWDRQAVAWCRHLLTLEPHRRLDFLELLLESEAFRERPDESTLRQLGDLERLTPGHASSDRYRARTFWALTALRYDEDLDDVAAALELANRYEPEHEFEGPPPARSVVDDIVRFVESVADETDVPVLRYWEACQHAPELSRVLALIAAKYLDPQVAKSVAATLTSAAESDLPDACMRDKWSVLMKHAEEIVSAIARVKSEFQTSAAYHLEEVIEFWWDAPKALDAALRTLLRFLPRVCVPPFDPGIWLARLLARLTVLTDAHWDLLLESGSGFLIELEEASTRSNDAWRITRGLYALARFAGDFTVRCLLECAGRLMKASKTLGTLPLAVRKEILDTFLSHPLCGIDPADTNLQAILEALESHRTIDLTNPMSRRLRLHLLGERALTPGQIERDRRRLFAGWCPMLCDLLARVTSERLDRFLDRSDQSLDSNYRHALLLQFSADEHRRALRRVLTTRLAGGSNYPERHPANLAWFRKHPSIDPELWTRGIAVHHTFRERPIELSLERDPLEVLRLGTYVGSCLGLGGCCSYSAIAVVLDVNKQVVFARRRSGEFIARQILAINEDDKLVCFGVYPYGLGREIHALFRDYDLAFARSLRIPLADSQSDSIELILARDWWDDGSWRPETEQRLRRKLKAEPESRNLKAACSVFCYSSLSSGAWTSSMPRSDS